MGAGYAANNFPLYDNFVKKRHLNKTDIFACYCCRYEEKYMSHDHKDDRASDARHAASIEIHNKLKACGFTQAQLDAINLLIDSRIESALMRRDELYAHPCGIHDWDVDRLRAAIKSMKPKDEFHAGQVFMLRLLDYFEEHRIETRSNPVHQFEEFMDRVAASLDRDGKIDPKIDFTATENEIYNTVVPNIYRRKVLVGVGILGGTGIMGGAVVRGLDKLVNTGAEHAKAGSAQSEQQAGQKPAESFFERVMRLKSEVKAPIEAKVPTNASTDWKGSIRSTSHLLDQLQPCLEFTGGSLALWYGLTEYQKARFDQVANALGRLLDQTRTVKRREDVQAYGR